MYRQERVRPNQLPPAFAGKGNPRALWESVSHKSKTYRIMEFTVISSTRMMDGFWWTNIAREVVHEPTGYVAREYAYFRSKKRHAKNKVLTFPDTTKVVYQPMKDKRGKSVKDENGKIVMVGRIKL